MKFKVEFNTDNAAFEENAAFEIENMLHFIARQVSLAGNTKGILLDANGNTVGKWSWE